MPYAVADEGLLTRNVEFHQTSAELNAYPRAQRLIENVLLVSESSAYIRLDYPELAPVHSESLSYDTPCDVRDLSGRYHYCSVALAVRVAYEVLDVAVLHRLSFIPALALDKSGLLDRFFNASHVYLGVSEYIVRELLMQKRRAFLHGLLRVEHERKFLVFDGLFK